MFVIEFSNGGGDIFHFSSTLNLEWNDLSIRGLIIPLMYRLLILAGTDEMNTSSIFVDDVKWISLPESKLKNKWEVSSPSGQKEMIVPDYDLEGIKITMTNELGIYQVFSNGEHITSFPTKLHNLEYLTNHLNQDDINKFIKKHDKAPHQRFLQNTIAEFLTKLVHSDVDLKNSITASNILFGKSTSEDLNNLDEKTFLDIFEGVPSINISFKEIEKSSSVQDFLHKAL